MKKFGDLKKGDIIYLIDEKNDYQIKPLKIKSITSYYDGKRYDIEGDITEFFNKTWSRSGLFCTEEKIATDFVEKVIKKKKLFATLRPGDTFYAINKKCSDFFIEFTVVKVQGDDIFVNDTNRKKPLTLTKHQMYSTNFLDQFWSIKCKEWGEFENAEGLFINKEDITTYFTKLEEKRKKKSIDKYVSDLSNQGKPISFLDNKGNQLHYGDKVAYVRRNGLHAHTDISFGIVTGESKTKIKILDEEELKVGKPNADWWNREAGQFVKSDGLHALEPQNVIFLSSGDKKIIEFKN